MWGDPVENWPSRWVTGLYICTIIRSVHITRTMSLSEDNMNRVCIVGLIWLIYNNLNLKTGNQNICVGFTLMSCVKSWMPCELQASCLIVDDLLAGYGKGGQVQWRTRQHFSRRVFGDLEYPSVIRYDKCWGKDKSSAAIMVKMQGCQKHEEKADFAVHKLYICE